MALQIAYGSPSGLTSRIATGITSAYATLAEPANLRLTIDAAQELIVNQRQLSTSSTSDVLVVEGSADRLPDAQYALPAGFQRALSLIGTFAPSGGAHGDLLVESSTGSWVLLVGATAKRRFVDADLHDVTATGVVDWCTQSEPVAIRGALVGEQGEIVGIACAGSPHVQTAHVEIDAAGAVGLVATDIDLGSALAGLVGLRDAKLVDVDGDGHVDLVLAYSGCDATTCTDAASALVVAWGNGSGLFRSPSVLPAHQASGFAVLEADGVGPERELAYVSFDGTRSTVIGVRVVDRVLEPTLTLAGIPALGPIFGSIIRAADLDGDGIDDLVISEPDGAHTFLACGSDGCL
jgi:hypothetical protein